MHKPQSIMRSF